MDIVEPLPPVDHPLPPVAEPRRTRVARRAKRVGVGIAGTTVLGAGVAMLVLPGPASW